jgi:uncharacterized membrane protein
VNGAKPTLPLLTAGGLAVIAIAVALTHFGGPALSAAVGVPLIVALPGYAVTAAILPERALGVAERIVFTLGLSLALSALSGLLLHVSSLRLDAVHWSLFLGLTTLGAVAVALSRSRAAARGDSIRSDRISRLPSGIGISRGQGALIAMAAAITVAAVAMATHSAVNAPTPGFTQAWLDSTSPDAQSVTVGMRSSEHQTARFRVEMTVNGQPADQWPVITLRPGKQWRTTAHLPRVAPQGDQVQVFVYREGSPQVYRRVQVWRKAQVQ